MAELAKAKRSRSRVAQEVVSLLHQTTNIAFIAAKVGITPAAARNILSRQGLSIRAIRTERRARPKTIQPGSPAAQLAAQAADTAAIQELRTAAEECRHVPADVEPALRAGGFPVPRRQQRRAAAAVLAELRAQATMFQGKRVFELPWKKGKRKESKQDWQPRRVIVTFTLEEERAVREYLAACGVETGPEYFGAKLVSQEPGRRKYLVPRTALEAIAQAAEAATVATTKETEEQEW